MATPNTVKNALLNQLLKGTDYVIAAGDHVSLHTGDPGTTGANEASGGSYARQPVTWADAASGSSALAAPATFTVPAGTFTHFGVWSDLTGGTFLTGGTCPSRTLGAGDEYTLTTATTVALGG